MWLFELITDVFGNVYRNYSGGYIAHDANNQVLDILDAYIADATLDLNFAKDKTLDSKVTFTRASANASVLMV